MSWFNLNVNESLNTLKGQLSNVSNAVHDVLTEGILEESDSASPKSDVCNESDVLIGLEAANRKIDELSDLCGSKDNEVS